jgi:hypothetical protein
MILKGEMHQRNCPEDHWNQLKEVLMKDENLKKGVQMKGIRTIQNNGSQVGQVSVAVVEEQMVHFTPFPLSDFFLFFLLLKF